jgi:hypothetical protein
VIDWIRKWRELRKEEMDRKAASTVSSAVRLVAILKMLVSRGRLRR